MTAEPAPAPDGNACNQNSHDDPILQSWKDEEDAVLRECLFILQGLDGDGRLSWLLRRRRDESTTTRMHPQHLLADEKLCISSSSFVLKKDTTAVLPASWVGQSRLGSGARDALSLCAEAGWLYGRVQSFIDSIQRQEQLQQQEQQLQQIPAINGTEQQNLARTTPTGSITRAFASALNQELQDYLHFLNQLETELDQLHLRQIRVRLREPIRRLQSLAMLTDSLQHLSGGPLLAAIQKHVRSGDPRHVSMAKRLLAATSKPWYHMLHLWTTEGILSDPAQEFFVQQEHNMDDHESSNKRNGTTSTSWKHGYSQSIQEGNFEWKDCFSLDTTKLPGPQLMGSDLVEPAFRVGKGVNFVRRCLMDGEWTFGADFVKRAKEAFCYYDSGATESSQLFRSTLTEALQTVHSHILESLRRDHHLLLHLYALKQFMFLGHGDFYTMLMDGLSTEYGNKVGLAGIYRHTLTSVLESALRSSNANYFPHHILQRLNIDWDVDSSQDWYYGLADGGDSSGLSKSETTNDKRRVWDIFAIDYSIPEALAAIVDEDAKRDYRCVFRSLFDLRIVEHHLNSTWRTSATLQHTLHSVAQQNGLTVRTSQSYANTIALLRQIAMTRQAMVHFVVNLKSYMMFEVLEGGWKQVVQDIQEAGTLDDIVTAHSRYLSRICRKSFLASNKEGPGGVGAGASYLAGYPRLGDHITELLELCKEFCEYQQQVFGVALDAADLAKEKRRQANERAAIGDWGFASEDSVAEEKTFFGLADSIKRNDLSVLTNAFQHKIKGFLLCADEILNGVYMASASRTPRTVTPNQSQKDAQGAGRPDDTLDSLRFLTFQLDQNNYYEFNHETGLS